MAPAITVQAVINVPLETVWQFWCEPEHITQWAFASPDWEAPFAQNDVRVGGTFITTMSAKDKSASFDFTGTYTNVRVQELIEYVIADGRKVSITFTTTPTGVCITETFEPEQVNPEEMQRVGWQAILDNFKTHCEHAL